MSKDGNLSDSHSNVPKIVGAKVWITGLARAGLNTELCFLGVSCKVPLSKMDHHSFP